MCVARRPRARDMRAVTAHDRADTPHPSSLSMPFLARPRLAVSSSLASASRLVIVFVVVVVLVLAVLVVCGRRGVVQGKLFVGEGVWERDTEREREREMEA